jgi:DNA-binding transcriptional LysR family regulator
VALLPEGHALARRDSIEPEDLAATPLVLFDKGSCCTPW